MINAVPFHKTMRYRPATTSATTGDSSDLMRRARSAAVGRGDAGGAQVLDFEILTPECLDGAHRAEAFLHHGDDVALARAHVARQRFHTSS